jgi:hypothetical protein
MSSPAAVAGIVVASIAGFFAVLAPFIIILLRRRRTSSQLRDHGAPSYFWSRIDGAAEYGKSFVDSIALLENAEQEVEYVPTRPYTATGRHTLLIDISSAYGYGHVTRNQPFHDEVMKKARSSPSDVTSSYNSTTTTQKMESAEAIALGREARQGITSPYVQESRREEEASSSMTVVAETTNTLIDISADERPTMHLQKRAEMTVETLNGPVDSGSARSKFASYTLADYEKALLEVTSTEKASASVSQATRKVVRKRNEYSEEILDGPMNYGSARSKFAAYTSGEYEKTMTTEAAMAPMDDCDPRTTKVFIQKRTERSEEAWKGPVNCGSVHVRGTRYTQEEKEKALMELQH